MTAAVPNAADCWRTPYGGLHVEQHRRQGRMFCGEARAPSSVSGGGSSDYFAGGSNDLTAAVLELEPLVERVASALEQRCGVRGGDLVRIHAYINMVFFETVPHVSGMAQPKRYVAQALLFSLDATTISRPFSKG